MALPLLIVVGALTGCKTSGSAPGFGVALELTTPQEISADVLARVVQLSFVVSGDESGTYSVPLGRTLTRTERLVYRPLASSFSIAIDVRAEDVDRVGVLTGGTGAVALSAGKTIPAGVILRAAEGADLGAPDRAVAADLDGVGDAGGGDLSDASVANPVLLGTEVLQSQHDSIPAGEAQAYKQVATQSGVGTTLSLYIDTNSSTKVLVGVYGHDPLNNAPMTLLGQGTIEGPVATVFNTTTISPVNIVAGGTYWIALLSPMGSGTVTMLTLVNGTGAANYSVSHATTGLSALPATFSPGTRYPGNSPVSAFVK